MTDIFDLWCFKRDMQFDFCNVRTKAHKRFRKYEYVLAYESAWLCLMLLWLKTSLLG